MALPEYQTGEDRLPIGGQGEVLPEELSNAYFQNLDRAMARAESKQMERTLGSLGDAGMLRSGDTFTRVAEDVLGPSQERRNQVILPEMQRAAGQGREERLGEVAYQRQTELQKLQHQQRLEELMAQAEAQKSLARLEAELNDPGGFDLANIGGQALGLAAGYFSGGMGAYAGQAAGKALFGGSGSKPAASTYPKNYPGY